MITETGTIVAQDADHMWIETVRASSCQSCNARAGCGQAVLGQLMDEGRQYQKNVLRVMRPKAEGDQQPTIGSQVDVLIEEGVLLKTAFLVYGFPLFVMLVATAAAQALGWHDLLVAMAGVSGLGLAFWWVKKIVSRWDCDARYQPQMRPR